MIKSIILGIVEGITEWLPISSTGHMILVNEFIQNKGGFTASDLYLYVIQLGAILAVVTLYFHKLNPFAPSKSTEEKRNTWEMWFKVIVACIPAAVIGFVLDDFMEHFENWYVVSAMLIIYGIAFIIVEKKHKKTVVNDMNSMTYKTALLIGMFQLIAAVFPGTSRSGATIVGALLIGVSRTVAAEYTFFLAIPVMFGASLLKVVKFGFSFTALEIGVLITGTFVSFAVSLLAVRFLMEYVKKHDFQLFGWYRIILGAIVLVLGAVGFLQA